jgi:hypothetical protein
MRSGDDAKRSRGTPALRQLDARINLTQMRRVAEKRHGRLRSVELQQSNRQRLAAWKDDKADEVEINGRSSLCISQKP